MQQAKSVLAQITNHAQGALRPSQSHEISPDYAVLFKAVALNGCAESQVVDHFHAECFITTELFIYRTPNQIECAGSNEIRRLGVVHLPRTQQERGSETKEAQHHALAESFHDQRGKDYEVIRKRRFSVSESASQGVFTKD